MGGLRVCVIGGGSTYTPEFIEGFIHSREDLPLRSIAAIAPRCSGLRCAR